jgi:GDPmannose 4,6-dehydratase
MNKVAVITGATGQDGSYLSELLLDKGYTVVALRRRSSSEKGLERIQHLLNNDNFKLVEADITDSGCVNNLVQEYRPHEVYNLAAQSHVGTSFSQPAYTTQVNLQGPLNFLEAIRLLSPSTKFYQASTSEMFGKNYEQMGDTKYQRETTAFVPQSPYAVAKLAAHEMVRIYRDSYGLYACCGILFNHESERRGENFVTRKITKWIGEFVASGQNEDFPALRLGNLDAHRDWGHAEDYVEAMYLMLQQDEPEDYVIATSETHSVREFLTEAFNEIGITNFEPYVVIDPEFYRPCEVDWLLGHTGKARKQLDWRPKVSFQELVQRMVRSDIDASRKEKLERSSLQELEETS